MRYIFFVLFCLIIPLLVKAQTDIDTTNNPKSEIQILEDTLSILGFAMINDSTPVKRFASCQKFIKTLVKALKIENSFNYPFEKIKTVSIQYAPDSTFRIFTWQLYVDINDYKYYGTIQMNQPELKMFPLIDRSEMVEDPEFEVLKADNWYGSLIYNIKSYDFPEGKKYLLFGFDGYRFFTKRKLVDILSFDTGEPSFGAPLFEKEDSTVSHRFILEYAADARVKLNHNPDLDLIVFDHLVETASPYPGQSFMYIPDGDLDGLRFEDHKFKYVRRIFDRVLEEAPRPEPVLDKSRAGKDLFGNKKEN